MLVLGALSNVTGNNKQWTPEPHRTKQLKRKCEDKTSNFI